MRMLRGIAGLMLMGFFCGCSAQFKEDARPAARFPQHDQGDDLRDGQPKKVAQPAGRFPPSVTGRGETVDTAKRDAILEAGKLVSIAMRLHNPPLESFVVNEDYVRTHVVLAGEPGKDEKVPLNDGEHVFKSWIVFFRTDSDWWKDIERRDQEAQRNLRANERQTLASRIVIGLSFLLLAGFGYVRLDEYTQRRYTTWLRVAGVGAATTVIAGWWWVFAPG
jgi:hypothetical protein